MRAQDKLLARPFAIANPLRWLRTGLTACRLHHDWRPVARAMLPRLAALAALLAIACAVDRLILHASTVTWVAYVPPLLVAPRLVPLRAVPLVIAATLALGSGEALASHGIGWEQDWGALVLVAIGLYALRDAARDRELEEAKTGLLRLVSHELRTPLHHIKGFASTLLQTDLEWDRETQRECLEAIEQDADRLTRLVETLLDMARVSEGHLTPQRRPCHPADLVCGAVELTRDSLATHPLTVDVPRHLPGVLADALQIEHVLANLLENAAKYSPPDSPIRVNAVARKNRVEIRVVDEGLGVAAGERRAIFRRFQRGTGARQSGAPGVGLGLSIAHELIAAHAGRIWVEPNGRRGSRFVISLPLAERSR